VTDFGEAIMFQDLLRMVVKVALASLVAGAIMTHFGITLETMMKVAGLTPDRLTELYQRGVAWALPNMLLGSLVIIPMWLLVALLRPPGRSSE
jgi:hypothetical protein